MKVVFHQLSVTDAARQYGHSRRQLARYRNAGKMRHLGIGAEHAHKRVIAVADDHTIIVIHLDTGEVIATNEIQPDRTYWRNTKKAPGRWPEASS